MRVGIALALLLICTVIFADIVELNDGTKIECTVVLEDKDAVFIKTNGETKSIARSEIRKITRGKKEEETPEPEPNTKPGNDEKLSLPPDNPGEEKEENPDKHNPGEGTPHNPGKHKPGNDKLKKLFETLKATCEALPSSGTDEERTFYRMRAIILQRHINSHGAEAAKIALTELGAMRLSEWKECEIHTCFLAETAAGCRDRDIVPYFWEEWLPPMLLKIQKREDREFYMKLIKKIVSEMQSTYSNTYRTTQYVLKPYDHRGEELHTIRKKQLRMPK
ncbi:unnamed protein product [marine sediment metagenome]|uniref:Uncharacterized protein n=1 Tax=marine sediment metagenome TaxID=412755 RepID=X0RSC5_9ZZZZ